jgi:hypothetical protein
MKEFIDISVYMLRTREERRKHLRLDEDCIEIGLSRSGNSTTCRALLAHFLGTTIGRRLDFVCHACNNEKCSNPVHLYWGTPQDNIIDSKECGTWSSLYSRTLAKHGEEKTREMYQARGRTGGLKGGPKTAELKRLNKEKLEPWRLAIESTDLKTPGWVSELASKMNCSHTHVRRVMNKHFAHIERRIRKSPRH